MMTTRGNDNNGKQGNVLMVHKVPLNADMMTLSAMPNASKICAPWYEVSNEIPILERIFNKPLSMALR